MRRHAFMKISDFRHLIQHFLVSLTRSMDQLFFKYRKFEMYQRQPQKRILHLHQECSNLHWLMESSLALELKLKLFIQSGRVCSQCFPKLWCFVEIRHQQIRMPISWKKITYARLVSIFLSSADVNLNNFNTVSKWWLVSSFIKNSE